MKLGEPRHSKLVERPLTNKQRVALLAIARGRFRLTTHQGVRGPYMEILAPGGLHIAGQFAALRRRGFVCWAKSGPALTLAGAFELFFEPGRLVA